MEKDVEKKFREAVRGMGGEAYKWVSPGQAGVPDRLVVLPDGTIMGVELKTDTGRLSKTQVRQIRKLVRLGMECWVLWGEADVKRWVSQWLAPAGLWLAPVEHDIGMLSCGAYFFPKGGGADVL